MLAHADHDLKQTYNQGCVNIRGPLLISRLRKAIMYQDTQEFDLTVITYHDNVPLYNREGCPMLHLMGSGHHIVVFGQHPQETAKFVGMTSSSYDAFEWGLSMVQRLAKFANRPGTSAEEVPYAQIVSDRMGRCSTTKSIYNNCNPTSTIRPSLSRCGC